MQGPLDCIEKRRAVNGLTKEARGPHLLSVPFGRRIVISRYDNDRQACAARLEFRLQFLTRQLGHSCVHHHAAGHLRTECIQELTSGSEGAYVVASSAQQAGKPVPRRRIVVHNKHTCSRCHVGIIRRGPEGRHNTFVV